MNDASTTSRDAVEQAQLDALRGLIAELIPSNRFYAPKLKAAGIDASIGSLDAFRRRMPFTTKQQLVDDQQANPPFGTVLTYPLERYTRFHQTSGTTRAPMRWLDTPESWQWMLGSWKRVFAAAGVTQGSHDRVFFAFSFGPFLGFWMAFEAAAQLDCLCIPAGGLRSAARLRMLLDSGATVLCCTPTYAIRLGQVAAEEGIDLGRSRVRAIIAAGEPGASVPAVRGVIEKMWPGARVFDHHGMTEIGPVTYEDVRRPMSLCVIEESYLAEVIDPQTDQPVEPGQVGELIITTLGRHGSPLLRYRTNDIVKLGYAEFDGGPQMVFDGGILGRADDMVCVRGVNVYPSAVDQIVRAFDEVAEYRVTVKDERSMAELSLEVEPAETCGDAGALCAQVAEAMRDSLALRVPVSPVEAGSLPRFEMKAKRWVRSG